MAVFNTAFGALPQYEDITGMDGKKRRAQTPVDEQEPRDFGQQYRAQYQAKQQAQPQAPTQTFAQMQAAGQARPAPPMMQAAAPPPPAMLTQLQAQLGEPAPAAAPAPAPSAADAGVAVQPPFVQAVASGLTATGGLGQLPPENKDGSRTFTNVEAANLNPTTYTAQNPPPPTAQNGSLYTDASGVTWTKRLGMWVVEGDANQAKAKGYAGLQPTALGGQTQANLPKGLASGLSGSGIDQFVRQYGMPTTDAQWEQLAQGSGFSVAALKTLLKPTAPPEEGLDEWTSGPDGPLDKDIDPLMGAKPDTTVAGGTTLTKTAPPSGGGAGLPGEFGISQDTRDIQARLRDILLRLEGAPSPYDSEAYKASEAAARADLEAKYGADRAALEEQLARQGLSASTFGAGRYGDLAGQQARALASMRADLLREAANQQAERQDVLLRGLGSLSGQMSEQDIAQFRANLDRFNISTSLENQLKEILQRGDISSNQIRAQLLSALIPQLDLSALSPEQFTALFKQYGLDLTGTNVVPKTGGTGGTGGGNTGGGNTAPGNVMNVVQIPTDLSPYPEGQMFNYNGTILKKQGNTLIDVVTGLPYRTELI